MDLRADHVPEKSRLIAMVSNTAIEEAERLASEGTPLTPREIVRLNALGLAMERGERESLAFALPRVAFLGNIVLREPTLGHEIGLDDSRRFADFDDPDTSLAMHALAFSIHDPDRLPKLGRISIFCAMRRFQRRVKAYTRRQIAAACRWVTEGRDERYGERAPQRKTEEPMDESYSVPVGVMLDGLAIATGISVGDARHLTMAQLYRVEDAAMKLRGSGGDVGNEQAKGDFYATLDELTARAQGRAKEISNNG
jgi:hypothetical protein